MDRWKIEFYPPPGQKYSPVDELYSLTSKNESSIIKQRLIVLAQFEPQDWPSGWIKKIGKVFQLKAGRHRVYFGLYENQLIIVCYICRKGSQKADPRDIRLANANWDKYLKKQESRKDEQ
jgi:hypothetical protein